MINNNGERDLTGLTADENRIDATGHGLFIRFRIVRMGLG